MPSKDELIIFRNITSSILIRVTPLTRCALVVVAVLIQAISRRRPRGDCGTSPLPRCYKHHLTCLKDI